jgi:hypothetical protein
MTFFHGTLSVKKGFNQSRREEGEPVIFICISRFWDHFYFSLDFVQDTRVNEIETRFDKISQKT